jgi:hypothetical protein
MPGTMWTGPVHLSSSPWGGVALGALLHFPAVFICQGEVELVCHVTPLVDLMGEATVWYYY